MKVAGMEYDREASEELRAELIALRDDALAQADFEWSVKLAHAVAWMAVAMDQLFGVDKVGSV